MSEGNKSLFTIAELPAAGMTSHLDVLNQRPISDEAALRCSNATATSFCSPARQRSSKKEKTSSRPSSERPLLKSCNSG